MFEMFALWLFGFSWLAQDMILRAAFVGNIVDFGYSKIR
jgi:hypothetical protein